MPRPFSPPRTATASTCGSGCPGWTVPAPRGISASSSPRARYKFEISRAPDAGIWIDGVFSGSIGSHSIDWANRSTSIGYWIDSAQQARGIMTRCCASLLDYLFDDLLLHRVEIRCGTGNTRSCAIPQRLGFMREGVLREAEWVNGRWVDLVVWSMLEDAWREGAASRRGATAP